MHIILWQFQVQAEHAMEFRAAYGPGEDWVQLFRLANGYLGTELLQSDESMESFVTIDRWRSEEHFLSFKQQHRAAYETLDAHCEHLTKHEQKIGSFRYLDEHGEDIRKATP